MERIKLSKNNKAYLFFDFFAKFGLGGMLFFIPISNALIDSFFGFFLLGFIGKKAIDHDFSFLKQWVNVALFLFFLFMSLSLLSSGKYISTSLIALFLKWGKYILIFLFMQDVISGRKDILIFSAVLLFSATIAAISGISQLFCGIEFLRGREIQIMKGGVRAITSGLNHCNSFGGYLVIPFFLSLSLFLFDKSSGLKKCLLLSLALIFSFCIFHTYSRGAWIGVLAGLLAMTLITRKRMMILVVCSFLGIILLYPKLREIFFSMFVAGGDSLRFEYWRIACAMFKENPILGEGLGLFMTYVSNHYPGMLVAYAHNCYLQILAESGVPSLISFLIFISMVLYCGIRQYRIVKDSVLLGGLCGVIGFLMHSFFDVQLYSLPLATLFWLWLGMVFVLGSDRFSKIKHKIKYVDIRNED
jgi:O-antigen ligase